MSHSYKKRSRRKRSYQSYTYRSREYRLRQYRKRRIRRRLLFSLSALLLLLIGGHVISIYASKGQMNQARQTNQNTSDTPPEQTDAVRPEGTPQEALDSADSVTANGDASPDSTANPDGNTSDMPPDSSGTKGKAENTDSKGNVSDTASADPDATGGSGKEQDTSAADEPTKPDTDTPKETDKQDDAASEAVDFKPDDDSSKPTEFSFENTLFIGDSRTEGLFINTGLTEATFYAIRGLNVENIYTKDFIKDKTILAQKEKEENEGNKKKKKSKKKKDEKEEEDSGGVTILEALKYHSWRKIYIMLGVNELGWTYESVFIERYTDLIRDIKELQPEAEIVIQSILPVTKEKSDNDDIYNNKRISRYNELIQAMAEEEAVTYADLTPAVSGKNGALPKKGSSDGVHLTKSYYIKWLDYLIAHEI